MAITPQPGYMIDPKNPNGVVSIASYQNQQAENARLASAGYSPDGTPLPKNTSSSAGFVDGTNVPLRNDQQSNPNGYNGTPENPTNTDSGLASATRNAPSFPTRNAGESASDFATRILNSPFYLAGGGEAGVDANGNKSAFVYDPGTNSYVAKPASSINRAITTAPRQNSISGANTSGSGIDYKALIGGEGSDAEKSANAYLDSTFQTPQSESDIIAKKTEDAKSRIQANKDYYASLLTDQAGVNELRTRETNARAVLNGLSGSSEASTMATDTATKNTQANEKIRTAQNVALEGIYKDIQDTAHSDFLQQKEDATSSAKDILARGEANRTKAVTNITTLAKSGFDFASIKANDPVTYLSLAKAVGGEAQLNAISVLNRPQEAIIDKKVENGKYVIAYQNPLTGKVRIESTDLGVPPQYTKSIDLGDKIMLVPDNFDPAKDKPIYISKGIPPKAPSNPTISEVKTSLVDQYTNAFSPGKKLPDGTPTISPDGFATFTAWKEAIKEAPTKGIPRADFIKNFGYLLLRGADGNIDSQYGLTPAEKKIIGTETDSSSPY